MKVELNAKNGCLIFITETAEERSLFDRVFGNRSINPLGLIEVVGWDSRADDCGEQHYLYITKK